MSPIVVTFNANGGSAEYPSISSFPNNTIQLQFPAREGHVCMGWFNSAGERVGFPGDSYTVPGNDITLTAQ